MPTGFQAGSAYVTIGADLAQFDRDLAKAKAEIAAFQASAHRHRARKSRREWRKRQPGGRCCTTPRIRAGEVLRGLKATKRGAANPQRRISAKRRGKRDCQFACANDGGAGWKTAPRLRKSLVAILWVASPASLARRRWRRRRLVPRPRPCNRLSMPLNLKPNSIKVPQQSKPA